MNFKCGRGLGGWVGWTDGKKYFFLPDVSANRVSEFLEEEHGYDDYWTYDKGEDSFKTHHTEPEIVKIKTELNLDFSNLNQFRFFFDNEDDAEADINICMILFQFRKLVNDHYEHSLLAIIRDVDLSPPWVEIDHGRYYDTGINAFFPLNLKKYIIEVEL